MARRAYATKTLLDQLNQMFPNRSKVSDGWLGDAAHQARVSDHNPLPNGVVTAQDFTHSPGHLTGDWLADKLVKSGDNRIKYIIWNRRIWQNGSWKNYTGSNPHDKHLHLSVSGNQSLYDNANKWNLGDDMSTMGEVEFNNTFFTMFGSKVQPTDGDRKRWIGAETNTAIRQMFADPRRPDYQKYVGDLEKAVQSGGTAPQPPTFKVLEKGKYEVK